MNQSLAILLLPNSDVRLVRCAYHGLDKDGAPLDASGRPGGETTLFKTRDRDLKVGDLVIVPTHTRARFTVVQVAEVNVTPDFESSTPVSWVVQKFDTAAHDQVLAQEEKFLTIWREADRKRRQDALRDQFLAVIPVEMHGQLPTLDHRSAEKDKSAG